MTSAVRALIRAEQKQGAEFLAHVLYEDALICSVLDFCNVRITVFDG